MQAQLLAGQNDTVDIWRGDAIKLDKLAEAIAESPAAWIVVDKWLKKHHCLLADEPKQDTPAGG